MPTGPLVVAACQVDVTAARRDLGVLAAAIAEAAGAGARLIVLPELTASSGVVRDRGEADAAAEPLTGATVEVLRRASTEHGCVVVAGVAERGTDGTAYNAAVVLDRGELVGSYRKVHLWGVEKEAFAAGSAGPLVVQTSVGRVGTMVCYDLEFPEWVRLAAEDGAEVLAVPVNWPLRPEGHRPDPFEVLKARAAASTYRVHVVVADRCGLERGVDWYGGSLVCDVDGDLLAGPACAEQDSAAPVVLLAQVDLAAARDKRLGRHNDAVTDRRPDLY